LLVWLNKVYFPHQLPTVDGSYHQLREESKEQQLAEAEVVKHRITHARLDLITIVEVVL